MARLLSIIVTLVLVTASNVLWADIIRLRSGGEIRGNVVDEIGSGSDSSLADQERETTVETLSGVHVTVPSSEILDVVERPIVEEEYEQRASQVAETAQAHWELAEWCRENRLDDEEVEHLEHVIRLEPDHAAARKALGYVKEDGQWHKREDLMRERGLVQHGRRWVTPQERDLIIKTDKQREAERGWFSKIRLWHMWLRNGPRQKHVEALRGMQQLAEPTAIPALVKFFANDPNRELRNLYLGTLRTIGGVESVEPLVTQSLLDVDAPTRSNAFSMLTPEQYDAALPYYLEGLRHKNNKVVRRAAIALETIGDARAIPDLIRALITAHSRSFNVPEEVPTTTFSSNGAYGPNGIPLPPDIEIALRTGNLPYGVRVNTPAPLIRWRTVTIQVNEENKEVLSALQHITGETFGFDERVWLQWWTGKKSGL